MKRLMEKTVFCGLVTAWRLATVPTSRSPEGANATTEGVVRPPSAFSMTVGSPPSSTAMHEFVVPRSMPMVFAIGCWSPWFQRKKSESEYGRFFLAFKLQSRDCAADEGPDMTTGAFPDFAAAAQAVLRHLHDELGYGAWLVTSVTGDDQVVV